MLVEMSERWRGELDAVGKKKIASSETAKRNLGKDLSLPASNPDDKLQGGSGECFLWREGFLVFGKARCGREKIVQLFTLLFSPLLSHLAPQSLHSLHLAGNADRFFSFCPPESCLSLLSTL